MNTPTISNILDTLNDNESQSTLTNEVLSDLISYHGVALENKVKEFKKISLELLGKHKEHKNVYKYLLNKEKQYEFIVSHLKTHEVIRVLASLSAFDYLQRYYNETTLPEPGEKYFSEFYAANAYYLSKTGTYSKDKLLENIGHCIILLEKENQTTIDTKKENIIQLNYKEEKENDYSLRNLYLYRMYKLYGDLLSTKPNNPREYQGASLSYKYALEYFEKYGYHIDFLGEHMTIRAIQSFLDSGNINAGLKRSNNFIDNLNTILHTELSEVNDKIDQENKNEHYFIYVQTFILRMSLLTEKYSTLSEYESISKLNILSEIKETLQGIKKSLSNNGLIQDNTLPENHFANYVRFISCWYYYQGGYIKQAYSEYELLGENYQKNEENLKEKAKKMLKGEKVTFIKSTKKSLQLKRVK